MISRQAWRRAQDQGSVAAHAALGKGDDPGRYPMRGIFGIDYREAVAGIMPDSLLGEQASAWIDGFLTVMGREHSRRAVAACEAASERGRRDAEQWIADHGIPELGELGRMLADEGLLPVPAELRKPDDDTMSDDASSARYRWVERFRRVVNEATWSDRARSRSRF